MEYDYYKPICIRVECKEPKIIDNTAITSHSYFDYDGFTIEEVGGVKFLVVKRAFSDKREDVYLRFDEINNFAITHQRE